MAILTASQWAVVDSNGRLFCDYDTVETVEDSAQAQVPTEPQEGGKIYAYDKVPEPSSVTVTLLFGGDYVKQNAALSKITGYVSGTDVFTIITPEQVYENMTVTGYAKTRAANGNMNMLSITVNFLEIREGVLTNRTAKYSPRNPTSAEKVDEGRKQPSVLADLFGVS